MNASFVERIVFAIPFRPLSGLPARDVAERNLQRTIRAARRSAEQEDALIVVACNDEPDLGEEAGPDVQLLPVPFDPPSKPPEGNRDKSRKRRHIGSWLRSNLDGDSFCVVFLDADDLLHRELMPFVRANPAPSYVVDDGYVFDSRRGLLLRYPVQFHRRSGSAFICRFTRDELPTDWHDDDAPYGRFGSSPDQCGHQDWDRLALSLGKPPLVVPFPAGVYYANHDASLWKSMGRADRRAGDPRDPVLPRQARRILTDEFNAPDLAHAVAGTPSTAVAIVQAAAVMLRRRLGQRTPWPGRKPRDSADSLSAP